MKALVFDRFGAPDVLEYRDVPDPAPALGRAVVRARAIGLNFADVYRRRGDYHLAGAPPFIAGSAADAAMATYPPKPVGTFNIGFDSPML